MIRFLNEDECDNVFDNVFDDVCDGESAYMFMIFLLPTKSDSPNPK